jgi:hypothetical protein
MINFYPTIERLKMHLNTSNIILIITPHDRAPIEL